MRQPRGRTVWFSGQTPVASSEFAGQPFVCVDQVNWKEEKTDTGIVVLTAIAGVIGHDRPDLDDASRLHITTRPGLRKVTQSLQGSPEAGFHEEPGGYEDMVLRGTMHGLTMRREITPSYDVRTRDLLDTSGERALGDLVVVGGQIDKLFDSLDGSDSPLSKQAATVIQAATRHI